eukprot:2048261-Rhodomonas_salina.3
MHRRLSASQFECPLLFLVPSLIAFDASVGERACCKQCTACTRWGVWFPASESLACVFATRFPLKSITRGLRPGSTKHSEPELCKAGLEYLISAWQTGRHADNLEDDRRQDLLRRRGAFLETALGV